MENSIENEVQHLKTENFELKEQNNELWKIIEKQKLIIKDFETLISNNYDLLKDRIPQAQIPSLTLSNLEENQINLNESDDDVPLNKIRARRSVSIDLPTKKPSSELLRKQSLQAINGTKDNFSIENIVNKAITTTEIQYNKPHLPKRSNKRDIDKNEPHEFHMAAGTSLPLPLVESVRARIITIKYKTSNLNVKTIGTRAIKVDDKNEPSYVISVNGQFKSEISSELRQFWAIEKLYEDFLKKGQDDQFINIIRPLPSFVESEMQSAETLSELQIYLNHLIEIEKDTLKELCIFLSTNLLISDPACAEISSSKENGYYLGSIKLSGAKIIKSNIVNNSSDMYSDYIFCITVMEPRKSGQQKHVFFVNSEEEWENWLTSLNGLSNCDDFESINSQSKTGVDAPMGFISNATVDNNLNPNKPLEIKNNKPLNRKVSYSGLNRKDSNDSNAISLQSQESEGLDPNTIKPEILPEKDESPSGTPESSNISSKNKIKNVMEAEKEKAVKSKGSGFNWRKNFFTGGGFSKKNCKVFGVSLDEAIAVSKIKKGFEIPSVLYRAVEYLESKEAYLEEGIYRLSGSSSAIQQLKEKFDNDGDYNILKSGNKYDVHAVSGLLKLYFRELPNCVLTQELQPKFLAVAEIKDRRERVEQLGKLTAELPLSSYCLLRTLVAHLIKIVEHSEINKMTLRNIGIVFAPTLAVPGQVFTLMMCEFNYVFCVDDKGIAKPRQITMIESDFDVENFQDEEQPDENSHRNSIIYNQSAPQGFGLAKPQLENDHEDLDSAVDH